MITNQMPKQTKRINLKVCTLYVLGFIVIMLLMGKLGYHTQHYNRLGTVVGVQDTLVTFEDSEGYVWEFYGENFNINDIIEVSMFKNGTDLNVFDDTVDRVKVINKRG